MRPSVEWEMIPVPQESAPPEPSSTEFLHRAGRPSPDVFGRFSEKGVPDFEIPEAVQ